MVPVLYRFLGKNHKITKFAASFLKYYRTRMRRFDISPEGRFHTERTLAETDRLLHKVRNGLIELSKESNESETDSDDEATARSNTAPKMHAQNHFSELVRRNGFSTMLTGELGENNNAKIKAPYKGGRTNRQTHAVTQQLVNHERAAKVSRHFTGLLASVEPDLPGRKYETSGAMAIAADACCLTKFTSVRSKDHLTVLDIVLWSEGRVGSKSNPVTMEAFDTTRNPADRLMYGEAFASDQSGQTRESRLMMEIFGHESVAEEFLRELQWQFGMDKDDDVSAVGDISGIKLRFSRKAVVPAVWRGQSRLSRNRLLQTLRCHQKFHGHQWCDFVAVTGSCPDKGDELYYGRLLFFFHLPLPDGSRLQMAFLRWCSRMDHKVSESGETLKDEELDIFRLKYTTYNQAKTGKKRWLYGVILAESIIRKVHIVAGNTEAGKSLANPHPARGATATEAELGVVFLCNNYVWERSGKKPYELSETDVRVFEGPGGVAGDLRFLGQDST